MSPAFGGAQTSVTKRIARNRAPKRYRVLRGVTMRPAADGNRLFLLVGWRGRLAALTALGGWFGRGFQSLAGLRVENCQMTTPAKAVDATTSPNLPPRGLRVRSGFAGNSLSSKRGSDMFLALSGKAAIGGH
jgi:hypothetical protein